MIASLTNIHRHGILAPLLVANLASGIAARFTGKLAAGTWFGETFCLSTDRVRDQINAWREDLINLNRNNRLLYFRKTKSSTLEVRQPSASDLLDRFSNS